MADINRPRQPGTFGEAAPTDEAAERARGSGLPAGGDPAMLELVELLFFAYRDFTGDPDAILREFAFGRAHHRVLHFVGRYPGLRVADLLDILKITKQSLARVLKQLIDEGYVEQLTGESDRRERRLHLTERGRSLAQRLLAPQLQRIAAALAQADDKSMTQTRSFLYNMINKRERQAVDELFAHLGATEGEERGPSVARSAAAPAGPTPAGDGD
jgi:DNA-binding MarR family transcriptional regulator